MYYESIKVLDCTIRDGGLVNKHDFSLEFVRRLYTLLSAAGYRYSASDVTDVITWYLLTHHLYNCVQAEALYFARADYGMQ